MSLKYAGSPTQKCQKENDILKCTALFKNTFIGDRGIIHLHRQDELLKACLSISHARSVLITTGFPTHFTYEPPEENDGPPGALAIAAMLQALEKEVAIVTDQRAMNLNKKIIEEAVQLGKTHIFSGFYLAYLSQGLFQLISLSLSTSWIFFSRE